MVPPGFHIQVSENMGHSGGGNDVDRMLSQHCQRTAVSVKGKREKGDVGARWMPRRRASDGRDVRKD